MPHCIRGFAWHCWSPSSKLGRTGSSRSPGSQSSDLVCVPLGLRSLFCWTGDDGEMYLGIASDVVGTFDFQFRSKSRPF